MTFHARSFALTLLFAAACGDDDARVVPARTEATADPVVAAEKAEPEIPAAAEATEAMAIGVPLAGPDLARTILQLTQASERTELAAISADGATYQLVLPPGTDATRAASLARALGNLSMNPVPWPPATPPLTVELLAARGRARLFSTPSTRGEPVATLGDGTLVVGLSGTLPTGTSARTGENAWTFVVDALGHAAWTLATELALEEGCVPSKDAIAGALGLRLDDPRLAALSLGNFHLYRGGARRRGTYVVGSDFVALLERNSNCRTVTLDSQMSTAGTLEEFHHARDQLEGNTFVALAFAPEDGSSASRWAFYPPRASEPAVELAIPTDPTLATRQRGQVRFAVRRGPNRVAGYWAFSVQQPGLDPSFYASDGTTFFELGATPPPPPDAPNVVPEGMDALPTEPPAPTP